MLEELTIKNVAVIDKLSVSFYEGLTVLTGETGAGKSIIIDSINVILGARASKDLIRHGEERAEVEAVFGTNDAVLELLRENDIDCDDDCIIISRKITADGKSTARINGSAVTINMLREVAGLLINIHGQHDNQALLTTNKHRCFLDSYAKVDGELNEYQSLYNEHIDIKKSLERLKTNENERTERIDLLKYQINEILSAKLSVDDEEDLLRLREILSRAEEINSSSARVYDVLYDGEISAYDLIGEAVETLEGMSDVSDALKEAYDAVTSAMYTIEDAARSVRDFSDGVEFDEKALDETEERLDIINRLKRKYGGTVEAVIAHCERAQNELNDLETSDERSEELERMLDKNNAELKRASSELTKKRKAAAKALSTEIENALHDLNMERAKFCVMVTPKEFCIDGADNVEFMIETNPGEGLKPLVKIASGGELSRVMLAIKSVLAQTDGVDTMIFDEIDTGVSGSAAQKIAEKLKVIAKTAQVICITHLPQLASAADTHFLIKKDVEGERAKTSLVMLDRNGRIEELSRIVGGGDAGREYAEKILST